jgi:ribosomal protein L7/L12
MKWFSSDRSEDPHEIVADVSSQTVARLREAARQHFGADLDERTVREVLILIQQRQKIEAIKVVRTATRQGLKESKDLVEHLEELLKKAV